MLRFWDGTNWGKLVGGSNWGSGFICAMLYTKSNNQPFTNLLLFALQGIPTPSQIYKNLSWLVASSCLSSFNLFHRWKPLQRSPEYFATLHTLLLLIKTLPPLVPHHWVAPHHLATPHPFFHINRKERKPPSPSTVAKRIERHFAFGRFRVRIPPGGLVFFGDIITPQDVPSSFLTHPVPDTGLVLQNMTKSQGMLEQLRKECKMVHYLFFKLLMWLSVPEEDYYNTKET